MTHLRIGIAGLGIVGGGLLQLLLNRPSRLADSDVHIDVTGVSARDRERDRGVRLGDITWSDDPVALAQSDDIDVFVELIGGSTGPAYQAVIAALEAGKHVVTANKALIAERGAELAQLAETREVALLFEAAVAGGVPVIRALGGGYAACHIERIRGILNGTCNYILSEMTKTGADFQSALAQAQRLGYAEADPAFDIGGMDAAHKIAILAMIGFDHVIDFNSIPIEGITSISAKDIAAADNLGYHIKLLGFCERQEGEYIIGIRPALVTRYHVLGQAEGPGNVVMIEGKPLGRVVLSGPGAGAGATAAAVAADIVSLARGAAAQPVFGKPVATLPKISAASGKARPGQFYLRQEVHDKPGAVAAVTETLARHDISIARLIQPSAFAQCLGDQDTADRVSEGGKTLGLEIAEPGVAEIVLTTYHTPEAKLHKACKELARHPIAAAAPSLIRIEENPDME